MTIVAYRADVARSLADLLRIRTELFEVAYRPVMRPNATSSVDEAIGFVDQAFNRLIEEAAREIAQ